MEGMSKREYSAHSGLSHGAIQKARKAGRLVVYSDGSINAAASDARRAEMTDPDQQRRSTGRDVGLSGPGGGAPYLKARTALTVYQAQERQLAIQKKKGTLAFRNGRTSTASCPHAPRPSRGSIEPRARPICAKSWMRCRRGIRRNASVFTAREKYRDRHAKE